MKITILGWGSLIWDQRDLPISGDWQLGGPVLPIEFSRISRDGRLTLVIDERNGVAISTSYVLSPRTNLDDAIADLRRREDTGKDCIGYVNLITNTERGYARQKHPIACDTIKVWAQSNGWEAVVWTALASNFEDKAKQLFTVAAAVQYVSYLIEPTKSKALEYLRTARPEVDTPVRRAVIQAGLIPPPQLAHP
jgi:hypothetical protein